LEAKPLTRALEKDDAILSNANFQLVLDRASAKCNRFTQSNANYWLDYTVANLDDFDEILMMKRSPAVIHGFETMMYLLGPPVQCRVTCGRRPWWCLCGRPMQSCIQSTIRCGHVFWNIHAVAASPDEAARSAVTTTSGEEWPLCRFIKAANDQCTTSSSAPTIY
jgi:hypothetical protein